MPSEKIDDQKINQLTEPISDNQEILQFPYLLKLVKNIDKYVDYKNNKCFQLIFYVIC